MSKRRNLHELVRIDHIAIAARDLGKAVTFYKDVLGFELMEYRETSGKRSGMISAVLKFNDCKIVLLEGVGQSSQVSRFISEYGPGVQHIAFEVLDFELAVTELESRGVVFSTGKLQSNGLNQIFTARDVNTGVMIELVKRGEQTQMFSDQNVTDLFNQLEDSDFF